MHLADPRQQQRKLSEEYQMKSDGKRSPKVSKQAQIKTAGSIRRSISPKLITLSSGKHKLNEDLEIAHVSMEQRDNEPSHPMPNAQIAQVRTILSKSKYLLQQEINSSNRISEIEMLRSSSQYFNKKIEQKEDTQEKELLF